MERVAIIGGGPAGLMAGQALARHGVEFLIFEAGAPLCERKHNVAAQLGCGIGGAGLFSDGKFSFFPSGTHLYTLSDRARLHDAYGVIERQLAEVGIPAPSLHQEMGSDFCATGNNIVAKDYPSTYGSLAQRNALIAAIIRDFSANILTGTRVEVIGTSSDRYAVRARGADGRMREEIFSHIVVATGRFGPQVLSRMMTTPVAMTDLRYEFGIRIEHPNGIGFLNKVKRPDVKYILDAMNTEVRTFCTCRNGEVWMIPYAGTGALSGRSDGPPSGYSNFGLLARFTGCNFNKGRRIWRHLQQRLAENPLATWQPLMEFLDGSSETRSIELRNTQRPWFPQSQFRKGDIAGLMHPELYRVLAKSVRILVEQFPDIATSESMCLFPAVEGVGAFPAMDAGLRGPGGRIWFCGDVVGRFRGLVPALVSGCYAGRAIATEIGKDATVVSPTAWPQVAAQ